MNNFKIFLLLLVITSCKLEYENFEPNNVNDPYNIKVTGSAFTLISIVDVVTYESNSLRFYIQCKETDFTFFILEQKEGLTWKFRDSLYQKDFIYNNSTKLYTGTFIDNTTHYFTFNPEYRIIQHNSNFKNDEFTDTLYINESFNFDEDLMIGSILPEYFSFKSHVPSFNFVFGFANKKDISNNYAIKRYWLYNILNNNKFKKRIYLIDKNIYVHNSYYKNPSFDNYKRLFFDLSSNDILSTIKFRDEPAKLEILNNSGDVIYTSGIMAANLFIPTIIRLDSMHNYAYLSFEVKGVEFDSVCVDYVGSGTIAESIYKREPFDFNSYSPVLRNTFYTNHGNIKFFPNNIYYNHTHVAFVYRDGISITPQANYNYRFFIDKYNIIRD